MCPSKYCKVCRHTLPVTDFGKHRGYPDGYYPRCKRCRSDYNAQLAESKRRGTFVPARGRDPARGTMRATQTAHLLAVDWLRPVDPSTISIVQKRVFRDETFN